VVVITAVAVAYTATRPVNYSASTKVYVGSGSGGGGVISGVVAPAIADQATLLTSTETAQKVAKMIGYTGSPAGLAGSVQAVPLTTSDFLQITATESTGAFAAKVANAYAAEFVAQNSSAGANAYRQQEAELRSQIAALGKPSLTNLAERENLRSQIRQLQAEAGTTVNGARQIDPATGGSENRKSALNYGLAAALGSLIGAILLAYGLERLDPRMKSVSQAYDVYHHPVMATVMHDAKIEQFANELPALPEKTRESFRQLRLALDLSAESKPYRTIVVTSAVPGEGKSTVARNLALALAEGGSKTLLVDADLRRPRLERYLGVDAPEGLSHVLSGAKPVSEVIVKVTAVTADGNRNLETPMGDGGEVAVGFGQTFALSFLAAGGQVPNPPAALGSEACRQLLTELGETFDVVVIDTPPLNPVSDAFPLIQSCDAVLLVARANTDARSAIRASELLERIPGRNVVGLVINDVPAPQAAAYGYGYGYSYGYSSANSSR
jgi:Mrp family chromosome partitioning ATPase/capsular polysaccharide biosynthesis protein